VADIDSIIYLFTVESVYVHVTNGNMGSGVADRDPQIYLESAEKLRIFRRRYIVGTLTNKADVSI